MKRIFIPTSSGSDWQRLLAKPSLHWKVGRSAMTAAACWEAANGGLPPEVGSLLNSSGDSSLVGLSLLAALPEWQVALKGGDRPSSTDVLALCTNAHGLCVVAVEAKVLEDFGPLVQEKRDSTSAGQQERLAYLHQLLQVAKFADGIRYQLLHRTASALLTAEAFHAGTAVMLVHAFGAPADRKSDFHAFCESMSAIEVSPELYKTPSFAGPSLFLAWRAGDEKYLTESLKSVL